MPIYFLTEQQVKALDRFIAAEKRKPAPTGRQWEEGEDYLPPETYLARTPSSGIPRLVEDTGTAFSDDQPGFADCNIYQIHGGDSTSPRLVRVSNFTQRVFNIRASAVLGDIWVLVTRDKYGNWYVAETGSGSGTGTGTGVCIQTIDGQSLNNIPVGIPIYVFGVDADGCLIKVPVAQCP